MPLRGQDKAASHDTLGKERQLAAAAEAFEEAQSRLNYDDYDGAITLMRKAIALDTKKQEYASTYGSLLAELGKSDEATRVLEACVQQFPNEGYEKYMYLGQLLQGDAAISNLQKGVSIIQRLSSEEADDEEAAELRSHLASGLCSLAEMHMACKDADIQAVSLKCEPLLQQAREADARSPEPLQVLASLRNEQGRADEALQLLKQSLALWFRPAKECKHNENDSLENGTSDLSEDEDAEDMEEDLATPSFEFRFECAKLLLELDETVDTAIQILEDLMQESDSAVHVHFLLSVAHHAGGDDAAALECISEGEELIARLGITSHDPAVQGFKTLKESIQEEASREVKK